MKLKKTQELLKKKLEAQDFDTYAICVCKDGDKASLFPPMPTVTHILI